MLEEQNGYSSAEYDVVTPTLPGHDIHRRSIFSTGSAPLSSNRRFAKAQAAQLSVPPAMFEDYYALSRLMTAKTLRNLITAGDQEDTRLLRGMGHFHHHFRNSTLRIHDGARHGLPLAQPPGVQRVPAAVAQVDQANLTMSHC